jgi:hypothetical protein
MTVPQVNHATPMCDHLCRCTNCKPPLVGERSDALYHLCIGAAGLAVPLIAVMAWAGLNL